MFITLMLSRGVFDECGGCCLIFITLMLSRGVFDE